MTDNGKQDEKIIAVASDDPTYNHYADMDELPRHVFEEMRHFFVVYKDLENNPTAVDEVRSRECALNIIKAAIDAYKAEFCQP